MSIELAFDQIDGARGERTIVFLHGILGRGSNLRSIATRFIDARPNWTAWLVDLRGHGKSIKSAPGPSLEAVARDVVDLAARGEAGGGRHRGTQFRWEGRARGGADRRYVVP